MISDRALLDLALQARLQAYATYSEFRVGAALLAQSGRVYTGCNVENAAYPAAICAERVALGKAVSEGERQFVAMAVAGGKTQAEPFVPPCGVCRQVLAEFCGRLPFRLIFGNEETMRSLPFQALLPYDFSAENLEENRHADD